MIGGIVEGIEAVKSVSEIPTRIKQQNASL
jgi:hypothetical protein